MVACLGYQLDRQPKTSTHQARTRTCRCEKCKKSPKSCLPVNQGLILTGSAMTFGDFVN